MHVPNTVKDRNVLSCQFLGLRAIKDRYLKLGKRDFKDTAYQVQQLVLEQSNGRLSKFRGDRSGTGATFVIAHEDVSVKKTLIIFCKPNKLFRHLSSPKLWPKTGKDRTLMATAKCHCLIGFVTDIIHGISPLHSTNNSIPNAGRILAGFCNPRCSSNNFYISRLRTWIALKQPCTSSGENSSLPGQVAIPVAQAATSTPTMAPPVPTLEWTATFGAGAR